MRNIRAEIAAWAMSQVGLSDPLPYWRDVLPDDKPPYPKHWCGAMYLNGLHKVGLLLGVPWVRGSGLSHRRYKLKITKTPEVGDLAYFRKNQHYATVVGVSSEGVTLVNGNGEGGVVTITFRRHSEVSAYYSIGGLIGAG